MLEVRDLHVHYGNVAAVNGVSLSVAAGEIVAVIGPNGAGKSSTLRAISGLVRPSAGRIIFHGTDISGWKAHRVVGLGLSHAPEGRRLFPHMTVLENLKMGAYLRGDGGAIDRALEEVVARFPRLAERRRQRAGTLSGGEQQMLAIARALMTNPELLILDEATEGLAPLIRNEIWKVLRKLKAAGQSILIVDKNLKVLARLADRHYVLERGRVRWSGDSKALGSDYEAIRRFVGV